MAGVYVIGLGCLPAIIDVGVVMDAETRRAVTETVAVLLAPAVAALLAIRATTDERVRLAVPVSLIWFVTSAGLLGPGVAATVTSTHWIDGFAIDTTALGAAVAGFILVGGLWRAIYLGDEDFVRPWTSALGDARWMTMQDATSMLPANADVVIGEAYMPFKERRGTQEFHPGRTATWGSGGKAPILAYDLSFDSTHMLFFAGSGGYKTTSTVVPTARRYSGSMVVLDPALEIGEMVAPVRRRLRGPNGTQRRVITIDPESNAIQGCDVLELLRESKRQELVIGSYANMLLTEKPKATSGSDAFFEGNNYGLMSGLLMYVLHGRTEDYEGRKIQRPTLRQLRTLTALPEAQLKSLIGDIYANTGVSSVRGYIADEAARTFIRQSLAPFVTMAQDSWTGISAQVSTDTKWLTVESLAATVCSDHFSLKDLPKGETDVFLQFAGEVVKNNAGVIRVLVGSMFRAMLTQERPKGSKPVLFVLDEVDLLGYMSALEEARDRGRKYGISLMLLYQSVGQLEKHFSKKSATAWFDSAAIVSYAAIKSPETAKRVSEQCGETTVEVEGSSTQSSWRDGVFPSLSPQGRNTRSISLQKPLILPHEVRQMRSDEQIVLVRGKPALRCGRAIYFRRPEMLDGLGTSRLRATPVASTPGQQLVLDEQTDRLAVVKAAGSNVAETPVAAERDQPEDDLEAFAMHSTSQV